MITHRNEDAPVVVFGEGSAAVFLIAQLIQQNQKIVWAGGSGARILPVMPYVKSEKAMGALVNSQAVLTGESFSNPVEKGTLHRVFRNKGFKMPSWKRTSNPETQKDAFQEMVWAPEQAFMGVQEFRIAGLSPAVVETQLREHFEPHPLIQKISGAPLIELEIFERGGKAQFADGTITEFSQFFFCDSLSELKALPKLSTVFKLQLADIKASNRMSALQVVFQHSEPLQQVMDTGIVIPLNRDAGDTFDRDAMGYFIDDHRSVWTVFLQPSEIEENHEIMKKFRKMKQALNRAFDSPEFMPEGHKEFTSTVAKEQVRFEEGYVISEGSFKPSKSNEDFVLMTDSFGISHTLEVLADRFSIAPIEYSAEVAPVSPIVDDEEITQHAHPMEHTEDGGEAQV